MKIQLKRIGMNFSSQSLVMKVAAVVVGAEVQAVEEALAVGLVLMNVRNGEPPERVML